MNEPTAPGEATVTPTAPASSRVFGLVKVTFTAIGTSAMHASVTPLEPTGARVSTLGRASNGPDLTIVPLTGSGDGTIQLEPVSTGSFTQGTRGAGGLRYLYATFKARNAQSDGTPYNDSRTNLTFLAVGTIGGIGGTAIMDMSRFDGSAADPAIAQTFIPTGQVYQGTSSALASSGPDVLQVLTEAEAASFPAPLGVASVFPYGFVVRNPSASNSRTLSANPSADEFDGVVTFAFKVPLQAASADDPFTVTAIFLPVDDSTTRVTQSPEEHDAAAQAAFEQRATDLGAGAVTLLSGGAYGGTIAQRTLCGARVAGPVGAPTAVVGGTCLGARGVIYVNAAAAPAGNGTTWATAYTNLQDALTVATPGDSIWVAAGTYSPGTARTATFRLASGVTILGGFTGSETDASARNSDPETNGTVLSGDVLGDDTTGGSNAENNYHVTTASGTDRAAVLDGFTIAAGNANIATDNNGGGMYNASGSPSLQNLRFTGNSAFTYGGGLYNDSGADPNLFMVQFEDNRAEYGGGMASDNVSGASLINITFSNNTAGAYGGGLLDDHNSVATLTFVTFVGNSALHGGGMADLGNSTSILKNVSFTGNRASGDGGGLANESGGDGTLVDVTFIGNIANYGGGLFAHGGSPKVANARFLGDSARRSGGGVFVDSNEPVFVNVLFSGNVALAGSEGNGGGMYNSNAATNLVNVTFSGNTAAAPGGALANVGSGAVTIVNSIFWGDPGFFGPGDEISSSTCGTVCPTVTVAGSIVQGGVNKTGVTDLGGNRDVDPLFVDADGADNILGTADDNLQVAVGSPAIDAGNNSQLPTDALDLDNDGNTTEVIPVDLAGNPRVVNTTVDRGAYEKQ